MLAPHMMRDLYNSLTMKCPYCGVEGFGFLVWFDFFTVWGCMEGRSVGFFAL